MGVARLAKVTIISPRSEYADVAKVMAQFGEFHPVERPAENFDPGVQELTVKAVKLFAEADQAVKDLELKLLPGQIDIVFRGVKIPQTTYEATTWKELLEKAESQLTPITDRVKAEKAALQKAQKDEADAKALTDALQVVSGFSSDLAGLSDLRLFKGVVLVLGNEKVPELGNSLPDAVHLSQPISKEQTLMLVVVKKSEESKLDKTMKLLELKPLLIPEEFPQNPSEAFRNASERHTAAVSEREKVEAQMDQTRKEAEAPLLAARELAEAARKMLDEVRVSGSMKRMAMISGYIPAKKEAKMKEAFGRWIVHTEEVDPESDNKAPTLMENRGGLGLFQPITLEQGIPGRGEVDPTPIVAFAFPVFFGMMFGDVGHGLILTLFMLLVRQRSTGTMRQWANMFLVAGISAMVFGVIFGEFFELSFYSFVPIPPLVEIIHRAAGSVDTFNFLPTPFAGVNLVLIASILIGVAHLTTALGIDVYQAYKEHDRVELFLEKLPVFTMYVSGVGYGLAFIGVGFTFNVLKLPSTLNPLLGIPNNVLGAVSLAVLIPSMLVILAGKSAAIAAGRLKGGSTLGALSNGGLEVFERISQFMSNTISYVRLAVMLLVHAALLLIINLMQPWANPIYIAPWVVLNLLIIAFEAFIVYIQDLRLHLYEFFTKFFTGSGTPFRKILPDRMRVAIDWR